MLIYVSHPFTGDEKRNKEEARKITANLARTYPNKTFINPLDTFQALADTNPTYEQSMRKCLELLDACQAIVMTGDWKTSRGCNMELRRAWELQLVVYQPMHHISGKDILTVMP